MKIFRIKTSHFFLNILYFIEQTYKIKYYIHTDLYISKFYLWPITNQQKKRILIGKRNNLQNRFYKSSVRTLTKRFLKDLEIYKDSQNTTDKEKVQIVLNSIYSLIDKGSKKNVYHKNTAARKKSKLAALLKLA